LLVSNIRRQLDSHRYHLPNGLREALLQQGYAKSLLVIEGMYYLKYAGDTWLSFNEIYRLLRDNFGMSYQLVYWGLRSALIFQRRKAGGRAYQVGACPYLYRLPYPEELEVEFAPDSKNTPHDKLERADLKSVTSYRLALHRELYIRKWLENGCSGFEMYRDLQAARLGVSVRSIRTYDKILGFSNEANYKELEIVEGDWKKLPRYKDKFDESGKRLASRKWLKVFDWKTGEKKNLPYVRYLAYKNLEENKQVYEVERLANTYYPYQKPDLSQFKSNWSVEYYWAEKEARNAAGFYQKNDGTWYHRRE